MAHSQYLLQRIFQGIRNKLWNVIYTLEIEHEKKENSKTPMEVENPKNHMEMENQRITDIDEKHKLFYIYSVVV